MSQKTIDDARREILADVACALFFHLAIKVTEETNFYPPTKQFFAFCVEILGQVGKIVFYISVIFSKINFLVMSN